MINAGPSNAATVALADTLPAGTTFVSLASPGGWSCTTPAVGAGGTVELLDRQLRVRRLVLHPGGPGRRRRGERHGDLEYRHGHQRRPPIRCPGNNSATTTSTVGAAADLSVTKTDSPDPVQPGANLTYTIIVANAGPSNAATVALADTLPAGTTFVSLCLARRLVVHHSGGRRRRHGQLLDRQPAPPAASAFTLVVAVAPVGDRHHHQHRHGELGHHRPGARQQHGDGDHHGGRGGRRDDRQKSTGANSATAGANLTYTITVSNGGPSAAANVAFSDTLPASTTFVSLSLAWPAGRAPLRRSAPAARSPARTPASRPAAPTSPWWCTVASSTPAGASIVNTATATSTTTDPD